MSAIQKLKSSELAEQIAQLRQQIEALKGPSITSTPAQAPASLELIFGTTPASPKGREYVEVNPDLLAKAKQAVTFLLERKVKCGWQQASQWLFGKNFNPTMIDTIVSAFNMAEPGADALIVNKKGKYGVEVKHRHELWCFNRGIK